MPINTEQTSNEIKAAFSDSFDLVIRDLTVCGYKCALIFVDGMSNKDLLERDIIRPLLNEKSFAPPFEQAILQTTFFSEEIKNTSDVPSLCAMIAQGDIAFVIDGAENFFVFSIRKYDIRSITEPPTEGVTRGPREGFIEDMKTNMSLLRRKLRTPSFVIENMKTGRFSNTNIAICRLKGVASDEIVQKIKSRISKIDTDGIIDSSYIMRFISERRSLFCEAGMSEKPDIVAAKILEGRVAIIVDGSPEVLTVPYTLLEDMQDSYDYYTSSWRGSFIRVLRILGALTAILLPAGYVALQSYHYQLLPLKFLISLITAIKGIPFTPSIEMLVVLMLFEIMSQASIRMPRIMGVSLSIIGAIVLGDTAVKAGLISSPAVLIIAISSISIFCVPNQIGQLRILRFVFLCVSSVLGLYGLLFCVFLLLGYLTSANSYGTPYLAPFAPLIESDLKDSVLMEDMEKMKTRPLSFPNNNRNRRGSADSEEKTK